jgi:TPR repeat protein
LLLLEEGGNGIRFINNAADMYHVDAMFYMLDSAEKSGNYNEAFRFAKRLSMAGYHEGTKRLADYFWNGKGVRRDKRTAKDLYRDAATAGNKEAAEILKTL